LIEQGLGTGALYSNNLSPAWIVNKGNLEFDNVEELNKDICSL
jgi:acyl-ACP thioesterase